MGAILSGGATPAQLIAFSVALRIKGETADELSGLLDAVLGGGHARPARRRAAVAGRRHRRHGWRSLALDQRVDDGRDRHGRRRRAGVQARRPGRVVAVRHRRRARGARRGDRAVARRRAALHRGGRHRVLLRAAVPSGVPLRRPGAPRGRRPAGVQPARADGQSGSGAPPGDRCGRRPLRRADAGVAARPRLDRRLDRPRRRARRADDDRPVDRARPRARRQRRARSRSIRSPSGSPRRRTSSSSAAIRRTTPTSCAACSPASAGRTATSSCSTPPPPSSSPPPPTRWPTASSWPRRRSTAARPRPRSTCGSPRPKPPRPRDASFGSRRRAPTSARGSTPSASPSTSTPRSGSSTSRRPTPTLAKQVDEHHPASIAFAAAGGDGRAVGAVADPDRSRARVQRGDARRGRCRGRRAAAAAAQALADRRADVLAVAAALEGHADNVAASLYGGVVATDGAAAVRVDTPLRPDVVLWIPEETTSTSASRTALPAGVPFDDAVFNVGRTALLRRRPRRRRRRRPRRGDAGPPAPGSPARRGRHVPRRSRRRDRCRRLVRMAVGQRADGGVPDRRRRWQVDRRSPAGGRTQPGHGHRPQRHAARRLSRPSASRVAGVEQAELAPFGALCQPPFEPGDPGAAGAATAPEVLGDSARRDQAPAPRLLGGAVEAPVVELAGESEQRSQRVGEAQAVGTVDDVIGFEPVRHRRLDPPWQAQSHAARDRHLDRVAGHLGQPVQRRRRRAAEEAAGAAVQLDRHRPPFERQRPTAERVHARKHGHQLATQACPTDRARRQPVLDELGERGDTVLGGEQDEDRRERRSHPAWASARRRSGKNSLGCDRDRRSLDSCRTMPGRGRRTCSTTTFVRPSSSPSHGRRLAEAASRRVPVPADIKPFVKQPAPRRRPLLGRVRRIVDGDDEFRARLAAAAVPELVDDIGIAWLRREPGWEERVAELIERREQEAAERDVGAPARPGAAPSSCRRGGGDPDPRRPVGPDRAPHRAGDGVAGSYRRRRVRRAVRARDRCARSIGELKQEARHARDRAEAARRALERVESERDDALRRATSAEPQRDELLAARAELPTGSTGAAQIARLRESGGGGPDRSATGWRRWSPPSPPRRQAVEVPRPAAKDPRLTRRVPAQGARHRRLRRRLQRRQAGLAGSVVGAATDSSCSTPSTGSPGASAPSSSS